LTTEDKSKVFKSNLKGVPKYSLSPTYRLGVLVAVAFFLSAITGLIMAPHYIATPQDAYASTLLIYRRLPFGSLIFTIHVYAAYSLVILSLVHMVRDYFVSAYLKPREPLWILGFLLSLVAIVLCFTGFLLPWFNSSKRFTDATIRFLRSLPTGDSPINLIFGEGDAQMLTNFYRFHTMVFPSVFLGLFILKVFLYLKIGPSKQISKYPDENSEKNVPWFPSVISYLLLISSVLVAGIIVISSVLPFSLPPEFSGSAMLDSTPYQQWYLLWIYNLMKMFDGAAARATTFLIVVVVGFFLFLLPFFDRSKIRNPYDRSVHTALGFLFIIETSLLTIWGSMQHILLPEIIEALIILGIPILAFFIYIIRNKRKHPPRKI
jgi:quinol-cytochrome oxidoreductase complex cytochrome b subunit